MILTGNNPNPFALWKTTTRKTILSPNTGTSEVRTLLMLVATLILACYYRAAATKTMPVSSS